MKKMILLMILLIGLTGCAQKGEWLPPASCADGSAILNITPNPTSLDRALLIIHVGLLERAESYSADDARKFVVEAKQRVVSGITYLDLMTWLNVKAEAARRIAGASIIVLGAELPRIAESGGHNPISLCDQELIIAHLNKHLAILSFY